MSKYTSLERVGQIKDGDKVATTYKGEREYWDGVTVKNPGEPNEEVIIDPKQNLYFITSMVVDDDSSWAKDVKFLSR